MFKSNLLKIVSTGERGYMWVDKLMALTPAFTEKLMDLQLSMANTSTIVRKYGYGQTKLLIRALFAKKIIKSHSGTQLFWAENFVFFSFHFKLKTMATIPTSTNMLLLQFQL